MTPYTRLITQVLREYSLVGYDPAAVEAWMRVAHSTLDALDRSQFRHEVKIACMCIDADPEATANMMSLYTKHGAQNG